MDYRTLTDAALLARLRELAASERGTVTDFVACLAEADGRAEVILGQGYPSLFEFCVQDLKLAESTAYHRLKAAKLVRLRPEILGLLAEGSVTLTNLCVIAPRLEEHPALLDMIIGKRKREVEELLASFGVPKAVPDRIRPLPPAVPARTEPTLFSTPAPAGATPPARRPTAGEAARAEPQTEFRFAAGPRFTGAFHRLRALLWHKYPEGRLEDLLYEAASEFIARRDPAREPKSSPPRRTPSKGSRRVPAAVRRAVWRRDAGRCAFLGTSGRCGESRGLEIDHVVPWALGGTSVPENLRLLCRAHNQSEATRLLGPRASLPGQTQEGRLQRATSDLRQRLIDSAKGTTPTVS